MHLDPGSCQGLNKSEINPRHRLRRAMGPLIQPGHALEINISVHSGCEGVGRVFREAFQGFFWIFWIDEPRYGNECDPVSKPGFRCLYESDREWLYDDALYEAPAWHAQIEDMDFKTFSGHWRPKAGRVRSISLSISRCKTRRCRWARHVNQSRSACETGVQHPEHHHPELLQRSLRCLQPSASQ